MHHQPNAHLRQNETGQNGDQLGISPTDWFLAIADAVSGTKRLQQAQFTVATKA